MQAIECEKHDLKEDLDGLLEVRSSKEQEEIEKDGEDGVLQPLLADDFEKWWSGTWSWSEVNEINLSLTVLH
jgi:hypothetical protein